MLNVLGGHLINFNSNLALRCWLEDKLQLEINHEHL